jgi:hypothetical protein
MDQLFADLQAKLDLLRMRKQQLWLRRLECLIRQLTLSSRAL